MDNKIQSKPSDEKRDWFATHELTKEQYAQLIANKLQRARFYYILNKVK
jgi:hypothetical protein